MERLQPAGPAAPRLQLARADSPLDNLSTWLTEAGVRHVKLDGRVSQKRRGVHAAKFKQGRVKGGTPHAASPTPLRAVVPSGPEAQTLNLVTRHLSPDTSPDAEGIPVMLAGVECMAEGHSFHLANNVILVAYSWAYDKFIQALSRVHRMNSAKPVNVYVVICQGTIDRRLESLIQDKGDAAELVLDGRLIGERTEEVNLAELLKIAHKEFDAGSNTIDEALLQVQWLSGDSRLTVYYVPWTTSWGPTFGGCTTALWVQFTYTTNNGTITIMGNTLYGSTGPFPPLTLSIPSTINNLPVTSLGDHALSCPSLTSVMIPNSVTSIGDLAFYDCTSLTNFTIPASVTSIGEEAFAFCGLTNVTIPNSVISIGVAAFEACGLSSVTIPDSITSIGNYAFDCCSKLNSVTISDSVTNIGDYAFYECYSLTSVYFRGNAPSIGSAVFSGDNSMTGSLTPCLDKVFTARK